MPTCPHCLMPIQNGHASCPLCSGSVESKSSDTVIGKELTGGYVIERVIGAGAMANVYQAEQAKLRRTVAVKVMHSHLMHDETTGRRFINEARAASRLNHPHSLAVIDFGRMDTGQPYMVMEHLRGRDLDRVVREDGLLSFARIVDVLLQLLDALSEAHELGIIHRDLKPENIIIEPVRAGGDYVKVVDFGLAKIANAREDFAITATGTVCGTPDFMSPEQCRGDKIDTRSDLYSVGVLLFVLLTGRVPFIASTPTQALLLHLTAPAPDPRQIAPNRLIPETLSTITLRALNKDPSQRFQTAQAFSQVLEEARKELALETAPTLTSLARATTLRCPQCGGFNAPGTKFCVECGSVLQSEPPASRVSSELALVGREDSLVSLLDPIQSRIHIAKGMMVCGEPGVGKTRLIREFKERAQRRGHRVVHVQPDPWGVRAAFHALREALCKLANLPANGGPRETWTHAPEALQRGIATIFQRTDLLGDTAIPISTAVREALLWALARARSEDNLIVLVFDDLPMLDAMTRRVVKEMIEIPVKEPVFIIGTHGPDFDPGWPQDTSQITLNKLSPAEALFMLEQSEQQACLIEIPESSVTPLYLEQALYYARDGYGRPPSRLGDLLALRISRMDPIQRQVLQGVAVLASNTTADDVENLIDCQKGVENALSTLVGSGLLTREGEAYRFGHDLVRRVVLNTIPAGVHRELCKRAIEVTMGKGIPVEAKVSLMICAEDSFEALLLLDQLGTAALEREDPQTAVEAFRQGLDFARDELVRGNLDDPMQAIVLFGRKLGEALTTAGRPMDGEGVLRETLGFTEPGSIDTATLMLSIARAAFQRDHLPEAMRWARQASQIASRCNDGDLHRTIEKLMRTWEC